MKSILTTIGFILLLTIPGCIVYHPHTADIPLIHEKKDLRLDAGVSLVPSANATVSYGLTDRIAIQGYGSVGSDDRYYVQGALGYYKLYENNTVLEVYGGGAYGNGDAYRSSSGGGLFGNYYSGYTQINLGRVQSKNTNKDFGISLKTGVLHSALTDNNFYFPFDPNSEYNASYIDNSLFLEPSVFARVGGPKLKFSIKLGGCWMYKFTHQDLSFPYSYFNLGIGINYTL